ncbi:MAG: NAD(P)-binding protein [Bacilli bacterium]
MSNIHNNQIFVIGCGNLGSAIATKLSDRGFEVSVIDTKAKAFDKLTDSFSGYMIEADATDIQTLEFNNVENSRLVVIATNNDNINIYLSHLLVTKFNVLKIIVRLNDQNKKILLDDIKNCYPIFPFSLCLDCFDDLFAEKIDVSDAEEE